MTIFFIFNLNCLNNPAKSVKILESISYLACTIFSLFFPDILVEMSLFLDRKMRLLLPDPTLNVESVILVILSLILYNSLCYSDPSTGQGRQLAKYSEKAGVQKESVVVKER